jgi:cellobiose-specific phosphotransferase system component IIA
MLLQERSTEATTAAEAAQNRLVAAHHAQMNLVMQAQIVLK